MKKDTNSGHAGLYFQIFGMKPGRGDEKRIRILEAFIDQLATRGLDNVSFESIAKKVGMIRTHVAYYFANRDEMIKTAIRFSISSSQQEMIGKLELAKGWRERLEIVVTGPFLWLEKKPKHAAIQALYIYLCMFDSRYRELQTSIQKMGEQRIQAAIADVPGMTELQSLRLARLMQATIAGMLQMSFASDYPWDREEVRTNLVRACISWVQEVEDRARKKS